MIAEALASFVDADVLARIAGPIGDAARAAQVELARLDPNARAKRASWAAAARTPISAGLRGIDATWIEAALEQLPARARSALASTPSAGLDVWLARWACAAFPPMPPIDASVVTPRTLADAVRMSAASLRAWLEEVGADQLAFALGAKVAGALGPRVAAAGVRIANAPRAGELGDRRAAIERAKIAIDDRALLRIGARAIAIHVWDLPRLQLSYRLPREIGLVVRAELAQFAASPLAAAPTWRALSA